MFSRKYILLYISIIFYITGFFFSHRYLWDNLFKSETYLDVIRNIFEYSFMFISLTFFNALLWKNKFTRVLSIFLIIVLTLNFMVSVSCFFIYDSGFNVGMAVSIIETTPSEVLSMSKMFIFPIFLDLVFLFLQIATVREFSRQKYKKIDFLICTIWLIFPYLFFLKHKYISNKGGGFKLKNAVYHFTDFHGALGLNQEIDKVKNNKINYTFITVDNGVENIVVLIGESVTPKHMSLYGYGRQTTPFEDIEKQNMFIYSNAVSPAAITNMSIPLSLSSIAPQDYKLHYEKLADNIVNVGNYAGYKTYWYSTQGGAKGITAIATFAQDKKWINGYDEELLPHLKTILKQKGKKLIFLHINGSHPNPCDKYPSEAEYFKNGNSIDCYDNSIRYTDNVIGQIFNEMKQYSSVFIYWSDHSVKIKDGKFLHTDSKESTKVPLYIWNSPLLPTNKRKVGFEDKLTQTTMLYPLIMEYMGLEALKNYKNEKLEYLKLDLTKINYNDLND